MATYLMPFSQTFSWGSLLICLILTVTMLSPLVFWLSNGWASKRDEIFASLSPAAKNKYLMAFSNQPDSPGDANGRFKQFYDHWYGRRHYAIPCLLIVLITFYETLSLADTALYHFYKDQTPPAPDAFYQVPIVAAAALSGAYVFVTYDLISRVSRRDLTTYDVAANALRMAGCIPIGYSLAGLAAESVGSIFAFAVGVFPLSTLGAIFRRIATKQLGLDSDTPLKNEKVVLLSGVDAEIAERLFDADVSTICQLAFCDPIQLTMRTNLSFNFVIDIVSEALAWIYLGDRLDKIRPMGLRGAIEIGILKKEAVSPAGAPFRKTAVEVIPKMAEMLSLDVASARNVIHEIADDATTEFLTEVYNRGSLDTEKTAAAEW